MGAYKKKNELLSGTVGYHHRSEVVLEERLKIGLTI